MILTGKFPWHTEVTIVSSPASYSLQLSEQKLKNHLEVNYQHHIRHISAWLSDKHHSIIHSKEGEERQLSTENNQDILDHL